jgi:hypothetical protein
MLATLRATTSMARSPAPYATKARWRVTSSLPTVTLKKKRRAVTVAFIVGGGVPVSLRWT